MLVIPALACVRDEKVPFSFRAEPEGAVWLFLHPAKLPSFGAACRTGPNQKIDGFFQLRDEDARNLGNHMQCGAPRTQNPGLL